MNHRPLKMRSLNLIIILVVTFLSMLFSMWLPSYFVDQFLMLR